MVNRIEGALTSGCSVLEKHDQKGQEITLWAKEGLRLREDGSQHEMYILFYHYGLSERAIRDAGKINHFKSIHHISPNTALMIYRRSHGLLQPLS